MESQKHWILVCNPRYYDFKGAFGNLDTIYWKQTRSMNRMQPGDIGFVYITRPYMRIMYMVEILNVGINLTEEQDNKDAAYNLEERDSSRSDCEKCIELKVTKACDALGLSLNALRENGFTGSLQTPQTIKNDELRKYIQSFFV